MLTRFLAFSLAGLVVSSSVAEQDRPNVLLICVDDLRPELGCYGVRHVATPNIDRLAAEGRVFRQHYVMAPSCGPSRWSLVTGRRPQELPNLGHTTGYRVLRQNPERYPPTLPRLFRESGYRTVGIGKVTHNPDGHDFGGSWSGEGPLQGDGVPELAGAWDRVGTPVGQWANGWAAFFAYADGSHRILGQKPNHENADVDDEGYPDGLIAAEAARELRRLSGDDRPFFLAVGFYKPHLPFNAPKRYFDLYETERAGLAPYRAAPANVDAQVSLHRFGELTPRYTGLKEAGKVTEAEERRLRQAYFACISYVDAQIGKVLAELDRQRLRKHTIVVLWSDHGYHLGDHGIWGKGTLHERSLHSPLIICRPRMPEPGRAAGGLVETIDLYPTLAELCGVAVPEAIHGRSFAGLLDNPDDPHRSSAVGHWRTGRLIGESVRTQRWRLTEYRDRATGQTAQVELYDHDADANETTNVAATYPEIVEQLMPRIRAVARP